MELHPIYAAIIGRPTPQIPHWEHWSCPDAETYLTGIDYYDHPRLCRLKLRELYPQLRLGIPETDDPKPRPKLAADGQSMELDADGKRHVRWGDSVTGDWDWGAGLKTPEEVLAFRPLEHDFSKIAAIEMYDYRDEATLYQAFRKQLPADWTGNGPEGQYNIIYFYNTLFMWPLLTFGWELFLETCLDEGFDVIMDQFAEMSRRVFRTFAKLPVNVVGCHDDIVTARGPVCSPAWLHKYIYPRYEEYWSMLHQAGKKVVMVCDGKMDAVVDDLFALGLDGIVTEPYTDFPTIARNHPDKFLAGEGDNRILSRNDDAQIKAMVQNMAQTARMAGGYAMCIGNHIPWNVTPQGVKRYLDYAAGLGRR